jgi:hypothetical protein|tara:strand:+ start:2002 stop:2316 length:315 start_codon:yes stop_codon:yes gene_type:complete
MGRISLDFLRRKSHDDNDDNAFKNMPGYLRAMHDFPTKDSKNDIGLLIAHKKDRLSMDEAREKVPVQKKTEEEKQTTRAPVQPPRKSVELERQDSANVRKVQVL